MWGWIYRLNIFQRLLIYFGVIIVVTITIVTWLIYQQATTEIKKQSANYLEYIVENASYQTDLFISDLEMATLPLMNTNLVKHYLEIGKDQTYDTFYYTKEIKKRMNNLLIQDDNINYIYLLKDNDQYISSKGTILTDEESDSPVALYDRLLEITPESGRVSVLVDESLYDQEYVVTMTRRVRGLRSYIPKGILGVEVDATALAHLWDIAQFKNGTSLWIFDENNRIVYHPNPYWVGKKLNKQLEEHFLDKTKTTFTEQWEEEDMIFYSNHSPQTNWTLVAMTPEEKVYEPVAGLRKKLFIALSASLLIAIVASIGFAKSIVNPLRKIQKGMKQTEVGEWEHIKPLKGTDEVSDVVTSYNKMIDKLSTLMEDLYEAELKNHKFLYEKQHIEFQALQSQINPHFLHNTLETVNAHATLHDEEEISEMVVALSQMFRYAVRNLEVVTIKEEIEHVKNFLVIEKHRFQKEVNVDFAIPPELYEAEIVKLTLQPLVENAIHHGLRKKRDKGKITIRARVEGNMLYVEILDNGSGISPERLKEIEYLLQKKDTKVISDLGIGVSNVNRRIQLIYGENYGLHITSILGKETKIEMNVPMTPN